MLGLFSGESSFGEIMFFYAEQIVASSLDFLQSLWHTCFFWGTHVFDGRFLQQDQST